MADVADVIAALGNGVAAALYPNGFDLSPAAGNAVSIIEGWPLPQDLDQLVADQNAGSPNPRAIVTVWPGNHEVNRTRYASDWRVLTPASAATLTITIDQTGTEATIGGTAPGTDGPLTNIGLLVDGAGYPYRVLASDTLDTIATALAALVDVDTPASAAGNVVTIPGAYQLLGRIGTFATLARETKRQERNFGVLVWAGTDSLRESVAQAIDLAYADAQWLALPDGSAGRIRYMHSPLVEDEQKAGLYRREVWFQIEYPTLLTVLAPTLIFPTLELQPQGIEASAP